jgi:hypothetical protein
MEERLIHRASGICEVCLFTRLEVLGVIGMGDRFLVRGGGGHWEFKDIPKELEVKIAKTAGFRLPATL